VLSTPVLAVTAQQSFGIVVGLLVTVGWILYLVANVKKAKPEIGSELELAANRKPYLDDEGLEGPRLDRVLTWGLISLTLIGLGLPLYWLAEPGRQAGAVNDFDEVFASRGEGLFAATADGGFNCAGCHGGLAGIGGEVQYTLTDPETGRLRQVNWMAPSLNDVTLRMTDEQIYDVLVYGRPFSPMPAWGLEGGGPMNDQQLDNLIAYMKSIAITPEEAQAQAAERAEVELERLQEGGTTGGTGTGAGGVPSEGQPQSASLGAALFNTNCARCHTLGYSYGEAQTPGGGAFGPSLYNSTNQFPSREDQIGFVSEGAENGERYGINGQSNGRMPYFSQVLTQEQIAAIVEYERLLPQREGPRTEEEDGPPSGGSAAEEGTGGGEDAEDEGGPSSSQSGNPSGSGQPDEDDQS
jgi:mono/diheme cytochrome c family protein